jgi:hypothetical protein
LKAESGKRKPESGAEAEDAAFIMFAETSPHECFIAWPARFIAYARKREPTATTAQIIARLRETAENSAVEGLVDSTTNEMRAPAA